MKIFYTAHATSIAGREGKTETDDKKIALKLGRPGSLDVGTNPEQLFACAYSACFGSSVKAAAKKKNVTITEEIKVQADISLNQKDEGGLFLGATLDVSIPGINQSTTESLVKDAHQICPYSHALRNNVKVTLKANNTEISFK